MGGLLVGALIGKEGRSMYSHEFLYLLALEAGLELTLLLLGETEGVVSLFSGWWCCFWDGGLLQDLE